MTLSNDIARQLAEAQRTGAGLVDQAILADIELLHAYEVQRSTMAALGETAGMYKVAIAAGGDGIIAPIYASRIGAGGQVRLPARRIIGLEVEIGMELARDLPPGSDRNAVEAAIGRYFVGIEVCGTRLADRSAASPMAGLADNLSAFGYAIGTTDWTRGPDIAGLEVVLEAGGSEIYRAPAKHGFGGVLNALLAYAKMVEQPYPLVAGTVLTTGSMCGLVPTQAVGPVTAAFGGERVTLELT